MSEEKFMSYKEFCPLVEVSRNGLCAFEFLCLLMAFPLDYYLVGFFICAEISGMLKEKPTRKTCFSREKKRLAPRICQAKFCLAAFL